MQRVRGTGLISTASMTHDQGRKSWMSIKAEAERTGRGFLSKAHPVTRGKPVIPGMRAAVALLAETSNFPPTLGTSLARSRISGATDEKEEDVRAVMAAES